MKRKIIFGITTISILLIISISFYLFFNYTIKKGNIKNGEVIIGDSQIYTKEEIQLAIDVVLNKFEEFPATLNKIWYDEEKSQNEIKEWSKQYNADEAIILYSNFKTYSGKQAIKSGFNSNNEYNNWSWILVRSNKEKWKLKTFGH